MKALTIATVFACALAASAANNTWWVDDGNYGKEGLDGKSAGTAYGTIQDALDNPDFAAGDTVKVLPGVYDKGERLHASGGAVSNRVVITKACTIISTDGRESTHVVGHRASTTTGVGADAVRCFFASVVSGVRIEGFTIRDGAVVSTATEGVDCCGGGFKTSKSDKYAVFADCTISNCVARKGAAAQYATLVRCLVTGNSSTGGSPSTCNVQRRQFVRLRLPVQLGSRLLVLLGRELFLRQERGRHRGIGELLQLPLFRQFVRTRRNGLFLCLHADVQQRLLPGGGAEPRGLPSRSLRIRGRNGVGVLSDEIDHGTVG